MRSPPSVATGTAYLGIDDGRVVALDLETGAVEWRAAAPGRRTAVVGNAVVANDREDLAVLAASDGGVRWRLDPPRSTVVTAPVVAGGQVYVLTGSIAIDWDDGVHAFDLATGRRRWRRDVGVDPLFVRAATLTLALGGGTLYVGGLNGGLTALQATTGATRFSFGVDEPVIVSPVVARDGLYLVGAPNAAAPGDAGFVLAVAGRGGGRRSTTAG